MKRKLCSSRPELKQISFYSVCLLMLVFFSLASAAQQKGTGWTAKPVEANYRTSPAAEKINPDLWLKFNPGKVYTEQAHYTSFSGDSAKYVEVVSKRNAYESFYIDAAHPSAFTQIKAFNPINIQR